VWVRRKWRGKWKTKTPSKATREGGLRTEEAAVAKQTFTAHVEGSGVWPSLTTRANEFCTTF